MPDLVLDGNILGLQVHGGVSSYVARLHAELGRENGPPELVMPRRMTYRGYGAESLAAAPRAYHETLPARLTQYLPAHLARREVVFHSAYYRRPSRAVARYVVTVHDFTYERFRSGPALWLHHRHKVAAIRAADAVICISAATYRDTLEFCPLVDPARLHVISHGVDLDTFHAGSGVAPSGMDRTVLYVGQRVAYKRFDLAVRAVALRPDLRLGFVGPPPSPEETTLLDRAVLGRWIWFGRVDDAKLRALYASAYVFIFPSDYEGFGLPVLEAMACGCPVLTSRDAALRELGGDAALFAGEQEPEAYVAALDRLGSKATRATLRARGHARATAATWQRCARLTLDVLVPGPLDR